MVAMLAFGVNVWAATNGTYEYFLKTGSYDGTVYVCQVYGDIYGLTASNIYNKTYVGRSAAIYGTYVLSDNPDDTAVKSFGAGSSNTDGKDARVEATISVPDNGILGGLQ